MAELRFRRSAPPEIRHRVQGMALLLLVCAGLLGLRGWWLRHPSSAPPPVIVEVRGAVPQPGYHTLIDPSVHGALLAAGLDPGDWSDAQLTPGTRIVVGDDHYHLEPMDELLVFGLPIDINTASAPALEAIPGIGSSKAAAIVADREEQGLFVSVEDLDRVQGIGPATVEKMREFVAVGSPLEADGDR